MRAFTFEAFRRRMTLSIAVNHLPFYIVAEPTCQELFYYTNPRLHLKNNLNHYLKSGNSIKAEMIEMFLLSQIIVIHLLKSSNCLIHISFDFWTSPNKYSMLGVGCHFIDVDFKARTILLGLKRLFGPHSGENIARLLISVFNTYKLWDRLGFCVIDNAGDNGTALKCVEAHIATIGVSWSGDEHRFRCFGHIFNLIMGAFTANGLLHSEKVRKPLRNRGEIKTPQAAKIPKSRLDDAITKLHIIIVFIMITSQRLEEFMKIRNTTDDKMIRPIKENDTRWFSTYLMISRALLLKDSITLFVANHLNPKPREKDLCEHQMSQDDWLYCERSKLFMEEFYGLVQRLEGKSDDGIFFSFLSAFLSK